ncbi:MAG: glycerophosphodiester phosphodiesterase [Promethearchaeota archaeon]
MKSLLVIGHKGASKICPENTLKAFKKAIELNADYIEFDVHLSKDKKIVVSHDPDIQRITGQPGLIKEMTLSELKRYDFGEGQRIPTLEEVIEITKNKIGLQIEIKARGMEKLLVDILKKEDLLDTTIVSCFIHSKLLKIQKLEPNLRLAALEPAIVGREVLASDYERIVANARKNNFFAIHPEYSLITKDFIKLSHQNGLRVHTWTVNDKEIMIKFVNMGIDGIITDDIEALKDVLNRK